MSGRKRCRATIDPRCGLGIGASRVYPLAFIVTRLDAGILRPDHMPGVGNPAG
jgi:hypothetical protein